MIPDGNLGKATDTFIFMTGDTKILRQIPFGCTAKVDKGFLVDNEDAVGGIVIDCPQKRLKKQVQQSSADTGQTQKVGNTRIVIENVNGKVKGSVRLLNALIPCSQFSIISKIVRVGFLLQNFKKPIIQRRNPSEGTIDENRPCRAEIRWYGATDVGLVDVRVRGNVRLWGLKSEVELHDRLSKMPIHRDKSPVEISEIVLAKRLDLEKRRELYRVVHGIEYEEGL